MMNKGFFISGTDTNIGKTVVASILVNKLNAVYYKPIQCGLDEEGNKDSDIVKKICINKTIIKEAYFFKKPLSPNIASEEDAKYIEFNKLKPKAYDLSKDLIIEGAGGLLVPINNDFLMIDLVKFFELPIILVCRTTLGTINHSLLSISSIKNKKLNLSGLVFVGNKEPKTINTILNHGSKIYGKKINILAHIPHIKKINKYSIDEMKNLFKKIP